VFIVIPYGLLAHDLRGFNLRDILQEWICRVNRGMTVMGLSVSPFPKIMKMMVRQQLFVEEVSLFT
jgi:hypothetical protein